MNFVQYDLPHCGHSQVVVTITEMQNAIARTISVGKYIQETTFFKDELAKRSIIAIRKAKHPNPQKLIMLIFLNFLNCFHL